MNLKQEALMKSLLDVIGGDPQKDSFRVKVSWKEGPNGYPETWAILEGVTTDDLATPETWLMALAGGAGGIYDFDCYASADIRKKLGDGFSISMNMERAPKTKPEFLFSAIAAKSYRGPAKVVHPLPLEKQDEPLRLTSAPPSPTRVSAAATSDREAELMRRETELMVKESEARILAQVNAHRPQPVAAAAPVVSPIAELAPMLLGYMKEQGEQRRADAAAAREERRMQLESDRQARADADKRFELLLAAMKPAPVAQDPLVTALLNKAINRDDSTILKSQSEAMAQTTSSMLQILHTQAEIAQMNAPQEDSPLMKLITKGIDAMVALNGGTMPTEPQADQEQLGAGEEEEPPQEEQPAEDDGEPPLMKLEKALRQFRPAPEIVELFCACLKDPEFLALRKKYANWGPFIDARMGVWTSKDYKRRSKYLGEVLLGAAFPAAVKRGLIGPEPERRERKAAPPAQPAAPAEPAQPAPPAVSASASAPAPAPAQPAPTNGKKPSAAAALRADRQRGEAGKKKEQPVEDAELVVEEPPAAAPAPAEPKAEA